MPPDEGLPQVTSIPEVQACEILKTQRLLEAVTYRANIQQLKAASADPRWQGAAANVGCVGLLVKDNRLRRGESPLMGTDYFEAPLVTYGTDPRFLRITDYLHYEAEWPEVLGTCFLIGCNRVLTARHVVLANNVPKVPWDRLRIVFGFHTRDDGRPARVFHEPSRVARVASLGAHGIDTANENDWAILNLLSNVDEALRPASVTNDPIDLSRGVYTLGHPNGLAMRFCYSETSSPDSSGCHRAFFDGYLGASGSPVFEARHHRVVGVLAYSGGDDEGIIETAAGGNISDICAPPFYSAGAFYVPHARFASAALAP
jgi:hypothetical protein